VTIAPVSNPSNRSLSSPSPSSTIAPQVNALSQQQPLQPVTAINSTDGQNYIFAATSPVVASGKLLVGLNIPSTLVTNDPNAAAEFYQHHDGQIILKFTFLPQN
jgi:hypothetical protein